jgi:hypothetical protein
MENLINRDFQEIRFKTMKNYLGDIHILRNAVFRLFFNNDIRKIKSGHRKRAKAIIFLADFKH